MNLGQLSSGFDRARWLAELAQAVDEAEVTASRLALTPAWREAVQLLERIAAARQEIRDLRLGGWRAPLNEIGSKRIDISSREGL